MAAGDPSPVRADGGSTSARRTTSMEGCAMSPLARRLLLVLGLVAIGGIAAPAAVGAADPPDPVLLVHGYRGNPSTWADMRTYLEANGRAVDAIDLPGEDNV